MMSLDTIVWLVPVVLKVAIALGMVIFVHELGHFLVAKACGVKCEKFFIGFDIGGYKLSKRVGETEYGIGILPLGGYVKMLGQDDDPAHIAEQMQKSQVEAQSTNAVPIKGPNGETYYVDRRSYLAKSVPQRMAIISAGVIMNVIFAFIFAVIAYGMGVNYVPSIVSETVPGSPAWKAGIEPGDEIVQINNTVDPTFMQLKGDVTLGDLQHGIQTRVRRAADGSIVDVPLKPQQEDGRLATIGLGGPQSLKLFEGQPVVESSPAGRAKLIAPSTGIKEDDAKFKAGDEIIRVGDVPVKDYREFAAELAKHPSEALKVAVRRTGETTAKGSEPDSATELTFEVPTQALQKFDFRMQLGPITAVQDNSPAAKAGLAAGDVLRMVDGRNPGEGSNPGEIWTAQTLPNYLDRAAKEGRPVKITIERSAGDKNPNDVTVEVQPHIPQSFDMVYPPRPFGVPLAANEIGIAYQVTNEIAAVGAASATPAGLTSGDRITSAKITFPKDASGKTPEPFVVKLMTDPPTGLAALIRKLFGSSAVSRPEPNWPTVLDEIQFLPKDADVELTVVRGNEEPRKVAVKPTAAEDAYVAARGFCLQPIERVRIAASFSEQVRYGWHETTDALTMVFRFLRKLGTQVPMSALGGPVMIAKAAGYSAAEGLATLLIFLTTFSANLAVLNLLPIPLLDGGHLVFLAYEGLRGRPANEKFVVALHTIGFVLIVSLMLYVFALDLKLIPRDF
jgi:regulator of sigma E protease